MSLLALAGGKGAPGATFLGVNLADALTSAGNEVLLVDLDRHGGDIAAYLGLHPRSGLYPLMRLEGKHPSLEALLHEAQAGPSGLRCVGGFPRAEDADTEMIEGVVKVLSEAECLVVADLGRIDPASAHLASKADAVIVAVRPDMVGVYAAQRAIQTLRDAGVSDSRINAVINGWDLRRSADLAETVHALKVRSIGSIPLHRREARKAIRDQRPLKKGRAFKSFGSLASEVAQLVGSSEEVPSLA